MSEWITPGGSIALVAAILLIVVRYFQDRPTTKILGERIEALEGARKQEQADLDRARREAQEAKAEVALATKMLTQKAEVEAVQTYLVSMSEEQRLEHKQIIVALQAISEQHTAMLGETKLMTSVLQQIANQMSRGRAAGAARLAKD